MKALILASLFFSSSGFTQTLDLPGLKALLTQKKAVLETVYPGMSKKLITVSKIKTNLGICELTETAVQTVLKIEGDNLIVHSKERYVPAPTPSCKGFEASDVGVLFYEPKPSLAQDLKDLDEAAQIITSILRAGDVVTLNLKVESAQVLVKYDLAKPSFKNTLLLEDVDGKMIGEDHADISVSSIDLTKVLFCASADSEDCAEGDFSDILF